MDYYKILGVNKNATDAEIKTAYRKMARKLHPDLNPNDKEAGKKFQQVNEANEVLSDPEKRKKFDKYGKDWKHGEEQEQARRQHTYAGGGGQYQNGGDFGGDDFSDFFSSMFGGQGKRTSQAKYRGQDVNAELELQLTDAYTSHPQTFTIAGKNVRITIPAGVENGQVIKLKGYGNPGMNGGPSGDLYITFKIMNNTKYRRDGNDLYTTADIDIYTAILGGETTIDTMSGKVKLKVNPETQTDTKIRLKGKGFPLYKKEGQFGDMYVTYNIKMPTQLTEKQKQLFKELSQF